MPTNEAESSHNEPGFVRGLGLLDPTMIAAASMSH